LISLQPTPTTALEPAFLASFRSGTLTRDQAAEVSRRDPLELKFLLLQLSAAVAVLAMSAGPHTPSSAWPPGSKPAPKTRPKKTRCQARPRGAQAAQTGGIDRVVVHPLPPCPCCGGKLAAGHAQRRRVIEDNPENQKVEAVEHVIPRGYCKSCDKQHEPKIPDALPNSPLKYDGFAQRLGLRTGLCREPIPSNPNAHR
jgi:hypothetical protein